jgi:hypothetical protein
MAVTRLTTNGLTGTKYDIASADNYYMEPIATQLLASAASSVTFSNIPQGYKHLQVRFIAIPTSAASTYRIRGQFNGDTGNNYATHLLFGSGTGVGSAAGSSINQFSVGSSVLGIGANQTVAGILDVLDYSNTNKYKTSRTLSGGDFNGSGEVDLNSGLWMNTIGVTSISLYFDTTTVATNSRFSLYGIKG